MTSRRRSPSPRSLVDQVPRGKELRSGEATVRSRVLLPHLRLLHIGVSIFSDIPTILVHRGSVIEIPHCTFFPTSPDSCQSTQPKERPGGPRQFRAASSSFVGYVLASCVYLNIRSHAAGRSSGRDLRIPPLLPMLGYESKSWCAAKIAPSVTISSPTTTPDSTCTCAPRSARRRRP